MKFFAAIISLLIVLSSCNSKFAKVMKSKDNEYKLKMAEQFYVEKRYSQAQQVYAEILPRFKGDTRYEDIYYKYAFTSYYLKDYTNAENLFKTYTENFPNSAREEECEYMRCMSYYKQSPKVDLDQTNTTKTIALLQAFINTHEGSDKLKDADSLMGICRAKLEEKEFKNADLYYNLGYYKAAAVAFNTLIDDYPDSEKGDTYDLNAIKAYYKYAQMSVPTKQQERFEKVIAECNDFHQRFTDSKLTADVDEYQKLSENSIKKLQNEQSKATSQL